MFEVRPSKTIRLLTGLAFLSASSVVCAANSSNAALGQWRDYALNSIKPNFEWADKKDAEKIKPTVLTTSMARVGRSAVANYQYSGSIDLQGFDLGVSTQYLGDRPGRNSDLARDIPEFSKANDLERNLVAPGFQASFGENRVRASVILAEQQFAFWRLGFNHLDARREDSLARSSGETAPANGVGFRVDLVRPLSNVLGVRAAAQSRVDMDAFMSYQGVYSEAGDFDIPASLSLGLDFSLTPKNSLSAGVERVYYTGIKPFTSNALPDEFLGLLGDGGSPVFAWQNLNIYSLAWNFTPNSANQFELRYSTSQQPEATSNLLNFALQDQFSDTNFMLGYSHHWSNGSKLNFSAAYSGAQFFLGNAAYADLQLASSQIEANLSFIKAF